MNETTKPPAGRRYQKSPRTTQWPPPGTENFCIKKVIIKKPTIPCDVKSNAARTREKKLKPVSYTHLDVYKRQLLNNLLAYFRNTAFKIIYLMISSSPVVSHWIEVFFCALTIKKNGWKLLRSKIFPLFHSSSDTILCLILGLLQGFRP